MTAQNKPTPPLKKILVDKGISQSQLAFDLKMSFSSLNRVINGWEEPSDELRRQLATYLSTKVSELFSSEGNKGNGKQK